MLCVLLLFWFPFFFDFMNFGCCGIGLWDWEVMVMVFGIFIFVIVEVNEIKKNKF
jgi:hypothetical protein